MRNQAQTLDLDYEQLMQNIQIGMGSGQQKQYTSCGFDMIDNYNQRVEEGNDNLPTDRVRGYTPAQLEGALIMTTRWNQWRDRIKQQNTNVMATGDVDELFANWTF